jgi:hypothetical protein
VRHGHGRVGLIDLLISVALLVFTPTNRSSPGSQDLGDDAVFQPKRVLLL